MVTDELKALVDNAHALIKDERFRESSETEKMKFADALFEYGKYAMYTENEVSYALTQCFAPAKNIINHVIKVGSGVSSWIELDEYCISKKKTHQYIDKYYQILKCESEYNFESFLFYMERYRQPSKKFYAPRQATLQQVAKDLSDLDMGKYKFYGLSLPARVGKSTLCIFFLAWIACKRPNSHSAMGGHSGVLAKGFYKELLNLLLTPEYTFKELFDYMHPEYANQKFPTSQSAEDYTITLGDPDRFGTISCRGADATWTGAIDVSKDGYLYIDDLVRDRTHSLSPTRMESTWQEYLNKMVDRKNDGARELMVGTLWSVLDPLERVRTAHEGDNLYKFRRIPALNDNDESNFQYKYNGFSTEYYREMRSRLDDAEWQSKYQQRPYIREGLLYPSEELMYFNGILPEDDSRIVACVDVAWGGGDSLSMPIGREYKNGDVYIFDWVFSSGAKEQTIPIVVGKIIQNEIRQCRFEGNVGGAMYSDYVDKELRRQNYKCSCTEKKAPNNMAKSEKIIAYSGDIKRRYHFLAPNITLTEEEQQSGVKRYQRSKDYQRAMDEITMYVTVGKNVHDDAVDSLTQLEMFIEDNSVGTVKIMRGLL